MGIRKYISKEMADALEKLRCDTEIKENRSISMPDFTKRVDIVIREDSFFNRKKKDKHDSFAF